MSLDGSAGLTTISFLGVEDPRRAATVGTISPS